MAQPGFEKPQDRPQPGGAAPRISGQWARQGQNIKGMLWVLIVGTLLVAGAYGVMLALQAKPTAVVNESRVEAAQETGNLGPGDGQKQQETPPSPQ